MLGKYYIQDNLAVYAGPQIGFLINAQSKIKSGQFEGSYDEKDEVSKLDLAIVIGGSYEVSDNIIAEIRFNAGLNSFDIERTEFHIPQRVIQLSLAYVLNK